MLKQLGLRSEIVLQLSLLMAAAIIFVSILVMKFSEQELLQQRVEQNIALLKLFARTLDPGLTPTEIGHRLERAGEQFFSEHRLQAIATLDQRQTLFSISMSGEQNWPDNHDLNLVRLTQSPSIRVNYRGMWQPFSQQDEDYQLVTLPVGSTNSFHGIIQARFSLSDIQHLTIQGQGYILLYALLCGLVLVLFGSYLLGKTVVRPIAHLQQASGRIADGELEQQVPVEGPKEIAQLAGSFNHMSTTLKTSRQQTETHIHSLERINRELQQTRGELIQSEKMASIGHLAAGMAHEIGNPLGALIGYLELLKAQTGQELSQEVLGGAIAEAARIDRLVRDLLDYARPEEGLPELIDPLKVLEEAVQLLDQQQALTQHKLIPHLSSSLPRLRIAPHKLQQVFINLLLNGRDASPPGGSITLSSGQENSEVWLRVSDQGSGIAAADLAHLFDPFFTTKAPGKGRGLGLFVSHRIISDAGGRIEVQSVPGEGTSFTILLPVTEPAPDEA